MEKRYELFGAEKSNNDHKDEDEEQNIDHSKDKEDESKEQKHDIEHFIQTPIAFANEFYNDNRFVQFFFAILIINPLMSLFIRRSQINRIFTRNQIKQLENTLIALLILIFIFAGTMFPTSGSGILRFFCFLFLVVHLCVENNGELVKGFLEKAKKMNK